ncbi:putative phosphoglycerate mutase pmu1 [Sporothrix epigloea]|uniref:Phosphoglycerate mutase pmu1 n=1 Tax=Sporothrix epigloea TaxID=1892477 RepID=A0ABP0E8P9_9PEZI
MRSWLSLRRIFACLVAGLTLFAALHSLAALPFSISDLTAYTMGIDSITSAGASQKHSYRYYYTAVTGVFLQSQATTVPDGFDYAATNFGLISRSYPSDSAGSSTLTQWQRFAHYVDALNDGAREVQTETSRVIYKVLLMGRHGEGDHNVAEAFYGTPAWNCYWGQQDGNGTVVCADARLTPTGEAQAKKANRFWAGQLAEQKQPAPQSYYTSPLTRCLQTASITFDGLPLGQSFIPTVKEFLREDVSTHTCDRRAPRSALHAQFPTVLFEDGFAETDSIWTGTTAETPVANDIRSQALLDDVFSTDDATWISFTSHSGEITSLLRVLGHRAFPLSTGQIIPVLVRAEKVTDSGDRSLPSNAKWQAADTCNAPPVTSVPSRGCVCAPTGLAPSTQDGEAPTQVEGILK